MEQILIFDEWLFHGINGLRIPLFDELSPFYRHKFFWTPLYIFIISALLYNFAKNGLWMVLFAIMTVGFSDTVSSKWIKHSVKRIRPCNENHLSQEMIYRVRCGGGYSFTSSHATNHGALAFFFFFLFQGYPKWWRWLGVVWAGSIAFAQVYVGVHYPCDVLAGLLLGLLIGGVWALLYRRFFKII